MFFAILSLVVGCSAADSPRCETPSWIEVGTLPSGEGGAVAVLPESTLVIGGWSSGNGTQDAVVDVADGEVVGRLPSRSQHHVAWVMGGDVYVLGGDSGGGGTTFDRILRSADGGRTWAVDGTLPTPLSAPGFVPEGEGGVLIGGFTDFATLETTDAVRRIARTETGWSFEDLAPLPSPRAWGAASALGADLVFVGGFDGAAASREVLVFSGGTWTTADPLPVALMRSSLVPYEGGVLLVGGEARQARTTTLYGTGEPVQFVVDVSLPDGRFSGEVWSAGDDVYYARGFVETGSFDTSGDVWRLGCTSE